MSNTDYNVMLTRLSDLQRPFTVVSAYLQCPDKNPSRFIVLLEQAFQQDALLSETPDTILNDLAAVWTGCIEKDPALKDMADAKHEKANQALAGHTFLCAIHEQPDLWNAALRRSSDLQTTGADRGRPSCDA